MKKNILSQMAVFAVSMLILFGAGLFLQPSLADAAQPNIILISADDMGWGDLCKNNPSNPNCANSKFATTNLDTLASGGVTLTNFYTPTPICSPSRAALMTGQDPRRPEVYSALLGVAGEKFLDQSFTTIAKILRDAANYNTAIIGKWHLGWDQPSPLKEDNCPNNDCNSWDHGFQYNYVLPLGIGQGHKGFCLVEKISDKNNPDWHYIYDILTGYGTEQYLNAGGDGGSCNKIGNTAENNDTFSEFSAGKSLTQKLTEKAIAYIKNDLNPATPEQEEVRDSTKPFFLYLSYPAPHQPLYIHLKQGMPTSYIGWDGKAFTNFTPEQVHDNCESTYKPLCESECNTTYNACIKNCETSNDPADCIEKCGSAYKACPEKCLLDRMQKCESSRIYSDVIKEIDEQVKQILDIVGDSNTIIIFTSDNGPYMGDAAEYVDRGSTGGLRGAKKFTYEGGVRVPFIARWAGGKWFGGVKREQPADMTDILPTLVRAAMSCPLKGDCSYVKADVATNTTVITVPGYSIKVDGKDISTVLRGGVTTQNKDIQISWFGNYPICVSWNIATGACSKAEDSYSFAIRSIDAANTGLNNYKLHIGRDRLPKELYNLSANKEEKECLYEDCTAFVDTEMGDLCWQNPWNTTYPLDGRGINYCAKCIIETTTNSESVKCNDVPSDWLDKYNVPSLWLKAKTVKTLPSNQ